MKNGKKLKKQRQKRFNIKGTVFPKIVLYTVMEIKVMT